MIRYISYVILVVIIEVAIIWGVSFYFETDFLISMFYGSFLFAFIAFFTGSSGDIFTKASEHAVFESNAGAYSPRHEKTALKVGPFLVGSILCFIVYLVLVKLL